jgi:small subunit ribosomal protein S2
MSRPHINLRQLINAGVHFGHTTRRWNPHMAPYIFGERAGVHILDLEQTVPLLEQAMVAVESTAAKGGRILFVGTKKQASEIVSEAAKKCGQYYINHRWLGGTLTNWKTVSNSIQSLAQMEKYIQDHGTTLTKKERLDLDRKREKLERVLGGIRQMNAAPDLIIVLDVNRERIAVQEANKLGIPIVGILDTNADPAGITYPVPGNDDARKALRLYCDAFAAAVLSGLRVDVADYRSDTTEEEAPADTAAA